MQRHVVEEFHPKSTLDIIRAKRDGAIVEPVLLNNESERRQLIEQYLDVSCDKNNENLLFYIL